MKITRREFLERAARQSLGAQLAATGLLAACGPTRDAPSGLGLDEDGIERLILLIDQIVPAAGDRPAASEAGTLAYFEFLAPDEPALSTTIADSLEAVEAISREQSGLGFIALGADQRLGTVRAFEATSPALFDRLRTFVYEGYYLQPSVWALMGYDPYPTSEAGPLMEAFDPARLDRVRGQPRLYTEI